MIGRWSGADVRAGWRDARRTDVGPRMSVRDAWRVGATDYRLGFLAARSVTR